TGEFAGVVALPEYRIDQRFVGFCNLPELRRRAVISRVDVRMILSRQPAERALDLTKRRVPAQSEQNVEIHGAPAATPYLSSTTSASMTSSFLPRSALCDPPEVPPSPRVSPVAAPDWPGAACWYSAAAALCWACVRSSMALLIA